ncbi:hypothetical protein ZIOFF_075401 [Zingiber officinale]|uniref:Uncharacterized protein n=1 Tax=Zingiber officinale TaxID=94328 RepID=A0A8J5EMU3_ZINOF|nr:hypothetical protein ZIOFF_075401 [Zingiber officinale]
MLGVAWNDNCNCTVLCTTLSDVTRLQLDIVHAMARLDGYADNWHPMALAIIIGAIPFLKNFILTDDAPLFFFTDSCLILGYYVINSYFSLAHQRHLVVEVIRLWSLVFFRHQPSVVENQTEGERHLVVEVIRLWSLVFFRHQPSVVENQTEGSGPGSKRLGLRTTAAIIFGRLVLVPPTGLGIITIADKLGLFPKGDKMFKFVLLL